MNEPEWYEPFPRESANGIQWWRWLYLWFIPTTRVKEEGFVISYKVTSKRLYVVAITEAKP